MDSKLEKILQIGLGGKNSDTRLTKIQTIGYRYYAGSGSVVIRSFPQEIDPENSELNWGALFMGKFGTIELEGSMMCNILARMKARSVAGLPKNFYLYDGVSATITQGIFDRYLPTVECTIGNLLRRNNVPSFCLALSTDVLKKFIKYHPTGTTFVSDRRHHAILTSNNLTQGVFFQTL